MQWSEKRYPLPAGILFWHFENCSLCVNSHFIETHFSSTIWITPIHWIKHIFNLPLKCNLQVSLVRRCLESIEACEIIFLIPRIHATESGFLVTTNLTQFPSQFWAIFPICISFLNTIFLNERTCMNNILILHGNWKCSEDYLLYDPESQWGC